MDSGDPVELTLSGVAAQAIELRTFLSALSAADTMIPINVDDLAILSCGHLEKLPLLVCRGLVEGRDPEVDCDALRLGRSLQDHHLEHCLSRRRRGVEALLMEV
jgi:hypothetical protein